MRLPEPYLMRMRALLGGDYAAYLAAMALPARRALRVNTLKIAPEAFERLMDFPLEPTGVAAGSFFFSDDVPIGRTAAHIAGLCYVQEPSAQTPAAALGAKPGMSVLDLCAAPGGKVTQLAALMGNAGLLVANEPMPNRAQALMNNIERLGVTNAVVTSMRPDALAASLGAFFDAVLADAPCSGEGMFRRDEQAARDWSIEHVRACAARQREILRSAADLLKPGGALVYSTCAFSPEEDEEVVDAFLAGHRDFALIETRRLYPHTPPGEGQFYAVLRRAGEWEADVPEPTRRRSAGGRAPEWEAFCKDTFARPIAREPLALPDGRVLLPPQGFDALSADLRVLRAGVLAGEARSGRFVPDHALCMAFPADAFCRVVPLEGERLDRYLAGEALPCEGTLAGWCAVTARGYPVGWGRAAGGTLKNHLPKGLRLRGSSREGRNV